MRRRLVLERSKCFKVFMRAFSLVTCLTVLTAEALKLSLLAMEGTLNCAKWCSKKTEERSKESCSQTPTDQTIEG